MTGNAKLSEIRSSVLDRMERSERNVKLAIFGAVSVETALFAGAFAMVDWTNHTERLLFIISVMSYTIVALGLAALGAHVTRTAAKLAAALDGETRV
jgi:hypothetical protein